MGQAGKLVVVRIGLDAAGLGCHGGGVGDARELGDLGVEVAVRIAEILDGAAQFVF